MPICTACKQTLSVDKFFPRKDRPKGHFSACKSCQANRYKERYRTDEAFRQARIKEATARTKHRRATDPAVAERDRTASREAMRRQKLTDPVAYKKRLRRNRNWWASNPDRSDVYYLHRRIREAGLS